MKVVILIFLSIFLAATRAWACEPNFIVYRDHDRVRLFCANLSNNVTVHGLPDRSAWEGGGSSIDFDDGAHGMTITVNVDLRNSPYFWKMTIRQYGNGSCSSEFGMSQYGDGYKPPQTFRRFKSFDECYADYNVRPVLSGYLRRAGQNPDIPTLQDIHDMAYGPPATSSGDRTKILGLVSSLGDTRYSVRRDAMCGLHRYRAVLPDVVAGMKLNANQRNAVDGVSNTLWLRASGELLLAMDAYLMD